ncbi:MAG: FliA/WhiG family RNA polymerase sigma factor [Oligoflexia bacterium]|nr:FliA/WhiG family RNA polymerase sigma factor [Oligoflexia bacterium]
MSQIVKSSKSGQTVERRQRERVAPGFGSRRGQKLSIGLTKAELIEKYRNKVRMIAIKMRQDLPPSVDEDDLFSMGLIGLMDAADKFDPMRGFHFTTYAEFRIRGAMIDGLREQDWVPRSARERMKTVAAASDAFESRNGRKPSDQELSRELQMPLDQFQEMMKNLGSQTQVNLEDLPPGAIPEDASLSDPFREASRKEAKAIVDQMLGELPEQQRMVLNFYYYRGLTLREIGQILDLTEPRVSQIHTAAVLALKNHLRENSGRQANSVEHLFMALVDE